MEPAAAPSAAETMTEKMEKLKRRKELINKQRQRARRVVESPSKQRPAAAAPTATPAQEPVAIAAPLTVGVPVPVPLRAARPASGEPAPMYRGSDTGIVQKSASSPSTKEPYRRSATSSSLGSDIGRDRASTIELPTVLTQQNSAASGDADWAALPVDEPYGGGSPSPTTRQGMRNCPPFSGGENSPVRFVIFELRQGLRCLYDALRFLLKMVNLIALTERPRCTSED